METKTQKRKIEYSKFRTNGFILDFFVKILGLYNHSDKERKAYQQFVKEEAIGAEEYANIYNNTIDDILIELFGKREAPGFNYTEQLIKEFFLYYNEVKLTIETTPSSQKHLDYIILINHLIPIISALFALIPTGFSIAWFLPDKGASSMKNLLLMVELNFIDKDKKLEHAIMEILDENKIAGYDSLRKNIHNWISGKNRPKVEHLKLLSKLSIYCNNLSENQLRLYLLLSNVFQTLFLKAKEYFGEKETETLFLHFRFLGYLGDLYSENNRNHEKLEGHLKVSYSDKDFNFLARYLDNYFYQSHDVVGSIMLATQGPSTDRFSYRKLVVENLEHEDILYKIKEKNFFNGIDHILPIRYYWYDLPYQSIPDINENALVNQNPKLIDIFLELLNKTNPKMEKRDKCEEDCLLLFKQYKLHYDFTEDPYYWFLEARFHAQKREYKQSTNAYLKALTFGKNCLGWNLKSIIHEGLIVSAQLIRHDSVGLVNAKTPFTKFYKEGYFYKLIDGLPDEINKYYLNDKKKDFDQYFINLYRGVTPADQDELLRNNGVLLMDEVHGVKIDYNNPNKPIRKVYKNMLSPLVHCAFIGNLSCVIKLIEKGADVDYKRGIDNYTALIAALENNMTKDKIKIVHLLISKMSMDTINAKLIKKQKNALTYAIEHDLSDIVKLLIEKGAARSLE